jgi:hypothetical protein
MNRLHLALVLSSSLGATLACGGISDPTLGGSERVASVSGALTGAAVPANARVALVYRSNGPTKVEVGSDVPIVGGKFTMNLGVPAAHYFVSLEETSSSVSGGSPPSDPVGVDPPPPPPDAGVPTPAPAPSGSGAFAAAANVGIRGGVVGGGITEPLTAALAGFVVYADKNGNGKLDLEGDYASSPDDILGGNKDLLLVYFQGGGALDYEKLRDTSAQLPAEGFNLRWDRNDGRWIGLNMVELKLNAKTSLPNEVCSWSSVGTDNSAGGEQSVSGTEANTSSDGGIGGGSTGGYPSPSDPNLKCSADGRSFVYSYGSGCGAPEPPPVGLCAPDYYSYGCAPSSYGSQLADGQPAPEGWPCPAALDGGPAPLTDAGVPVSVDAGMGPGGSAIDAGKP